MWADLVIFAVFSATVVWLWMRYKYSYWRQKGVEGPEPESFVGNLGGVLTLQVGLPEKFAQIYHQTKERPFVGMYMMFRPTLLLNDPELIKTIMIKDFAHFTDHGFDFNYKHEPLAEHVFNLTGERWKLLRAKLSPTFTSSRMKQMFGVVASCADVMTQHVRAESEVDVKELLAKFSTDVIGTCAFGIDCNSFEDPNSEFRKYGKMVNDLPVHKALAQFFMVFFFPSLMEMIPFSLLGKDTNDFFYNLAKQTYEYREKNNIVKNDFFQLLIELIKHGEVVGEDTDHTVKGDKTKLTLMQAAAQSFVFFVAGFDTSSTTGSFALYELALNPEIQETLVQEIERVMAQHGGKLTYESTLEMNYLTMVIEETLRKYPPLAMLFRVCTKEYTIPGTEVVIEKNTSVIIPLIGIQKDEQYFPEPEKFDPERFSPEAKASRSQLVYMPFGEGPRLCIGNRFGMMQTRLGLAALLSKYRLSVCKRTTIPMEYDKKNFVLTAKDGVWLKLTKRGQV